MSFRSSTFLSLGMMFEYTFQNTNISSVIKSSINDVLNEGAFTKDLSPNDYISTSDMGNKIVSQIKKNV